MTASSVAPSLVYAGGATDAGRLRFENEDRLYTNVEMGVFLVVDGVGGHPAGELAAETALDAICAGLNELRTQPESDIRRVITDANNRIFALAAQHEEWLGMACVLTVALLVDGQLTWGHVGDSRLYLYSGSRLRKLTSDHSPVGLHEDSGLLSEVEAMHHPDRNLILRDVGSQLRVPDQPGFIETSSVAFSPEDAFLLCTDGLSDALTTAEMTALIRESAADHPQATADALVRAANDRSGADNVTALFVMGSNFQIERPTHSESRHAVTRVRLRKPSLFARRNLFFLLAGILWGMALVFVWHYGSPLLGHLATIGKEWMRR